MRGEERLRFWAHELAAMATTGLEFATNDYDRDRFRRVGAIAQGIAEITIDATFAPDRPYLPDIGVVTPKIGCTVAAFDDSRRVALIERADNGRWALPGGYADVGSSPSENARRELLEETGLTGDIDRLVGVYDNRRFGSVAAYHFYTLLFRARIAGGVPTTSVETTQVRIVDPADLPTNMSDMQRTMFRDAVADLPAPVFQ